MIAGANKDDYHLRHVTPGEDFQAEFMDLRQVEAGDGCTGCGAPVEIRKTVEIGHIFKLGYKYSESMGLHVTNAEGEEVTPIMGSYGIGIERILSAAIELYHDKDGMSLPAAIAPFTVVVTPVNMADVAQKKAAEEIYRACLDLGLDALLDDRDERPGVKFKDADLIGVPFRITVGKKVAGGMVELVERRGKKTVDVPVAEAAGQVAARAKERDGD
jgi:prolyl-tRNA synthetase